MDPGTKLTTEQACSTPEDIEQMKTVHAVGSLMYLAVATRPDIAYAVGVLARKLDTALDSTMREQRVG